MEHTQLPTMVRMPWEVGEGVRVEGAKASVESVERVTQVSKWDEGVEHPPWCRRQTLWAEGV